MIEYIKQLINSWFKEEPEKEKKDYRYWTAAEMALFAESSDEYIAEQTNRSVYAVRAKRRRIKRNENDK